MRSGRIGSALLIGTVAVAACLALSACGGSRGGVWSAESLAVPPSPGGVTDLTVGDDGTVFAAVWDAGEKRYSVWSRGVEGAWAVYLADPGRAIHAIDARGRLYGLRPGGKDGPRVLERWTPGGGWESVGFPASALEGYPTGGAYLEVVLDVAATGDAAVVSCGELDIGGKKAPQGAGIWLAEGGARAVRVTEKGLPSGWRTKAWVKELLLSRDGSLVVWLDRDLHLDEKDAFAGGLFALAPGAGAWEDIGSTLPEDFDARAETLLLEASGGRVYLAEDNGLYRWEPDGAPRLKSLLQLPTDHSDDDYLRWAMMDHACVTDDGTFVWADAAFPGNVQIPVGEEPEPYVLSRVMVLAPEDGAYEASGIREDTLEDAAFAVSALAAGPDGTVWLASDERSEDYVGGGTVTSKGGVWRLKP